MTTRRQISIQVWKPPVEWDGIEWVRSDVVPFAPPSHWLGDRNFILSFGRRTILSSTIHVIILLLLSVKYCTWCLQIFYYITRYTVTVSSRSSSLSSEWHTMPTWSRAVIITGDIGTYIILYYYITYEVRTTVNICANTVFANVFLYRIGERTGERELAIRYGLSEEDVTCYNIVWTFPQTFSRTHWRDDKIQ